MIPTFRCVLDGSKVTPKELQKAKPPMPISINDFGSIFPRDSFRFPQDRWKTYGLLEIPYDESMFA